MSITGDIVTGIRVLRSDFNRYIKIAPYTEIIGDYDTVIYIWEKDKWIEKKYKYGEMIDENNLITIPISWAESLRDELVKILGRPEETATQQKLGATEKHLEDMRKLVFESTISRKGKNEVQR